MALACGRLLRSSKMRITPTKRSASRGMKTENLQLNNINQKIYIQINMKKYILISIAALLVCNIQMIGQTPKSVAYTYDNAGNRISRYIVIIKEPKLEGKSTEIENEDEYLINDYEREIQVYPNPVRDELFVDIQRGDDKENYRLMLFDSAGKMLKENRRQGNGNEPIDMSLFPSGVYFLIINTQEGKVEYKIVKE